MRWHFYDLATGVFSGAAISGSAEDCDAQRAHLGANLGAFYGDVDHSCQRLDLATGVLVDWQPPTPSATAFTTWRWDTATRRWVPEPTFLAKTIEVRANRDRLLAACDWVVARAFEHGSAVPTAWMAYRQALRDLPDQAGFPETIDWPAPPA